VFGLHGSGSEGSKEEDEVVEKAMAVSGGELELELKLELVSPFKTRRSAMI
jgi:hypothetical protein